jgi:Tfp pilus assembly protein FimT
MMRGFQKEWGTRLPKRRASRGFSLLELVLVVACALVLMAAAVPVIDSSLRQFALKSAVSAVTGAIQSTRYQAIFQGCKFQLAFNAATYTYTVSSAAAGAGGTACLAAPVAIANLTNVPLPGRNITLNANVTMQFSPGGAVTLVGGGVIPNLILTQANVASPETIQVSNYGNITVTP